MGEAEAAAGSSSRGLVKALEDLASRPAPLLSTFSPSSERSVEAVEHQPVIAGGADGTATVFRAEKRTGVRPFVALFLLFCTVQLDFLVLLAGPFLLPFRLFSAILGLFLFLALIPLYQNSSFAHKLSRFLCKYALGYFPVAVHVEDLNAFDSNEAYVFGYEPHSVLPIGILSLSGHAGFMPLPKTKLLVSNSFFFLPFLRHIWTWLGCIPATSKHFRSYLAAGYSCIVVPGGGREVVYLDHDSNSEVAFLKSRKGFTRVAIEMGRPIVPVFCFGQTGAYKWYLGKKKVFQNGQEVAPFFYWGRFGSYIPFRQPMHVVVGKPIFVKKNVQPSKDEVDEVHAQYVTALQELVEKHKDCVGYTDLQLRVI